MGDLSPIYGALAPDPNATYGQILPFARDNTTGATRWAMPDAVRSGLKGYLDLANSTQTGSLTGDALSSLTFGSLGVGMGLAPKGSVGIFGGRLSHTASEADLALAKAAERRGAYPDETWETTGWGRGADNNWRYEINDQRAQYLKPPDTRGLTLGSVLDHPALYKAYPELKNTRVAFTDLPGGNLGSVAQREGEGTPLIVLNNSLWGDADKARNVLLHEIQHLVQAKEGFAGGGSAGELGRAAYHRQAGEVEARNVEHRSLWGPATRLENPPQYSQDVPNSEQIVNILRKYGMAAPAPFSLAGPSPMPNNMLPAEQRVY